MAQVALLMIPKRAIRHVRLGTALMAGGYGYWLPARVNDLWGTGE